MFVGIWFGMPALVLSILWLADRNHPSRQQKW